MHTTIFSTRYLPLTGGVEYFTSNLAHAMVERGDEVRIVTSNIGGLPVRETQEDGVEIIRLPAYSLLGGRLPISKKNAEYKRVYDELLELPTDRVLVNTRFYPHSMEGLKLAENVGVPSVVLDHGSAYLTLGNRVADKVIERYEDVVTNRVKKMADGFAGISLKSADWLEHFGIDAEGVVCNAIDAEAFRAAASDRNFRLEFGIPEDRKVVSFIGRLEPEKGPDKLMKAARLVPEAAFLLAGEGSMRTRLETEKLDNVYLLGNLGRSDLSALLRDADVFCLPTRSEGFCTSLLEAGAWGIPAVITDVGGSREVVGDNSRGIIVEGTGPDELATALRTLLETDDQVSSRMSRDLMDHIGAHHAWGSSLRQLDDVFDRVEHKR
jgi:glycosyltransferase involved in cell wall biosynthesis